MVDAVVPNSDLIRPKLRPAGLGRVVPKAARTVEEFDVTTAEERQEAAAVPAAAVEAKLGLTVASLGDPTQAGFWIKTPLVKSAGKGRVVYPGSGKSVQVDLIPIEGESSAGSRLSLAAFRIIEAPLTELPRGCSLFRRLKAPSSQAQAICAQHLCARKVSLHRHVQPKMPERAVHHVC